MGSGNCTWGLLEGYLSDDPASAAVTDDLAAMQSAAQLAAGAVADIQRLEIASTRNLGYLTPPVDRHAALSFLDAVPWVPTPALVPCSQENSTVCMQSSAAVRLTRYMKAAACLPSHDPACLHRRRGGDGAGPGLVACTVCKRVMLARSFAAHGPKCRGPPKEPPPPKVRR